MTRARDTKRRKVYTAEDKALADMRQAGLVEHEPLSQAKMKRRLKQVTSSKWARKHHPQLNLAVLISFDRNTWASGGYRGVRFPPSGWLLNELTLLHELAHTIRSRTYGDHLVASHGWEWASVYVGLVQRFMGRDCAGMLKARFREAKIRFTKPRARRELTEEQRQALRDRLAAARARRSQA